MENKLDINTLNPKLVLKYLDNLGTTKQLPQHLKETFVISCIQNKLNPFKGEVYAIPYKDKNGELTLSIITSYKEYEKRASGHPSFEGYELIWINEGKPSSEWIIEFVGYRKDWRVPYKRKLYFKEWTAGMGLWVNKPRFMFEKVALTVGLRGMFPDEFANLPYTEVEQWNKEVIDKVEVKE